MLNPTFLRNKINRQINLNGKEYTFQRPQIDEYWQINDEVIEYISVKGILHQMTSNSTNIIAKAISGRVPSSPNYFILCMYEDGDKIVLDDEIIISDLKYRVVNKTNVNNFDIAFEIALELIDDGSKS